MNKPLLNKVLIVALIIIWALIGYKFLYGFSFRTETSQMQLHPPPSKTVSKKVAVFELKLVDRDPFLGTYPLKSITSETNPIKPNPKTNMSNNKPTWPQIAYYGYIQNETSKFPLVMISVNNKLIRVKKGDEYEGMIIQNVFRDSVVVRKGNQNKVFLKNK